MADAPVVDVPAPPAAPAAHAPAPSPAASSAPAAPAMPAPDSSAAPAPAPVPAPAVAAEAPPAAPQPAPESAKPAADAPIQPERSFLSQELDKQKPATEAKPAVEAAKPGEKPAAEPTKPAEATAPIAWEYTVPETIPLDPEGRLQAKISFDDEARTRVNSMFEAFSVNPRDKANQQALVDFHIERLAEQNRQVADFNRNFWNDTRKQWRERWAGDAEIGGSGIETSKAAAARVMDIAMRWNDTSDINKAFHRDVEEMFETTGVGDHPAMGRLLVRLARFMDESPPPPPNINPPKDIGKAPGSGRLRDRYKGMSP